MENALEKIPLEERTFPALLDSFQQVSDWVEEALDEAGCDMKSSMQILIAVEELFVNIAHYAYPGGEGQARVALGIGQGLCVVRFTDSGIPFDPLSHKDPDISLDAQERSIGGLGIYMVKKSMDSVSYVYENDCNVLTISKHFDT